MDAPRAGAAKVFGDFLEHGEVKLGWGGREFAERDNSIADVGTACDISIEEFSEKSAIIKTEAVDEVIVVRSTLREAVRSVHSWDGVKG